jgi:hypothetical protein
MTTQLSKSDRIRKLLHISNAEIAKRIGCCEAYVRAVRQRTSLSGNPINSNAVLTYAPTHYKRKRERYASDPEFRERTLAATARNYRKRRAEARAS